MNQPRTFPIALCVWIVVLDLALSVSQKAASMAGQGKGIEFYASILHSPFLWLCMLLPLAQLVLWTRVLSKVDLSLALPFTSLNYPLTMIAAGPLFHEQFSSRAWIGAVLITIGVGILGKGGEAVK